MNGTIHKRKSMKVLSKMKIISVAVLSLTLVGCTTLTPDVEKSLSRDKTMEQMAKTALINEMLASPDPHVRSKGAAIAEKFIIEPKKNILDFD